MALIFCPECGNKVSEHAITCGTCSYPISNTNQGVVLNTSVKPSIDNTIVWLVALLPLFSSFIISFSYGFMCSYNDTYYDVKYFVFIPYIISTILLLIDEYRLESKNLKTSYLIFWVFFFPPVYLYRRSRLVEQSSLVLVLFVLTSLVSIYLYK